MPVRGWRVGFGVLALSIGGWVLEHGPIIRDMDHVSENCEPLVRPSLFWQPPSVVFGLSFYFKNRLPKAFPIGSCSADLIAWLDWQGFSPGTSQVYDATYVDTAEEFARGDARIASGETILVAAMSQKAILGQSHFAVAWNSDDKGRLTEMFADTELFQFDLP